MFVKLKVAFFFAATDKTLVEIIQLDKDYGVWKLFKVQKYVVKKWVEKKFWVEKMKAKKNLGRKNVGSKNFFG